MASTYKMFFASILIGLGLLGIGLSIDLMRADNASKEYFQVLYFLLLLVLAGLGNIVLFTRNANTSERKRHLFDFSISLLSIVTGLFYLIAIEGSTILPFIMISMVGIIGIVRTMFVAQKAKV